MMNWLLKLFIRARGMNLLKSRQSRLVNVFGKCAVLVVVCVVLYRSLCVTWT